MPSINLVANVGDYATITIDGSSAEEVTAAYHGVLSGLAAKDAKPKKAKAETKPAETKAEPAPEPTPEVAANPTPAAAEPSTPAAPAEATPAPAEAATPSATETATTPAPTASLEEVRKLAGGLLNQPDGEAKLVAILTDLGSPSITALPKDKLGECVDRIKALGV